MPTISIQYYRRLAANQGLAVYRVPRCTTGPTRRCARFAVGRADKGLDTSFIIYVGFEALRDGLIIAKT